uniref:hypothetical protein n=1 Tax=Deinococcus sp. TaxID=47478 RepID=UPI00286990DD
MTYRFLPFLALSVALAACGAVPDGIHATTPAGLSAVSLTAPLPALGAQGLPFDASGLAVVGTVRVKIRDANAQLMTFDGQNVYQSGGSQDSIVLTKTASSARVLLPAGTYTLESAGTAQTGEFLAYGQATLQNVDGGSVKLALHALLDPDGLTVAFPAASIAPDTVQDARLIVPTVSVNGTRLTVPTSDYSVSFTASSGSMLGGSKLGARMKSDNQSSGSVGVSASVQGWVATGPDTAALSSVSVSGSVPISTTLTAGLYEENNASFMYSGSWTRNPDHAPSHGGGDEYAST